MKTFSEFLSESKTLSVAKKVNTTLPHDLKAMLDRWEAGNYPTDKLEASFRKNSEDAKKTRNIVCSYQRTQEA